MISYRIVTYIAMQLDIYLYLERNIDIRIISIKKSGIKEDIIFNNDRHIHSQDNNVSFLLDRDMGDTSATCSHNILIPEKYHPGNAINYN